MSRGGLLRGVRATFDPHRISRSVIKSLHMPDDLSLGVVGTWTDRINAIACTGTTTARPTHRAGMINGRSAPWFDGTANRLADTSRFASFFPLAGNAGFTIALVNNWNLDTATPRAPWAFGSSANWRSTFVTGSTNRIDTDTNGSSATGTLTKQSGVQIITTIFTGTEAISRINGRSNGSGSITPNTGTTRYAIGATPTTSGSRFWLGAIGPIAQFAGAPDWELIYRMEGWLADWCDMNYLLLPKDHFAYKPPQQYTLLENLTFLKTTMDAADGQAVPDNSGLYSPAPTVAVETNDDLPSGYGRQISVSARPDLFRVTAAWKDVSDGVLLSFPAGMLNSVNASADLPTPRFQKPMGRVHFAGTVSKVAIQMLDNENAPPRVRCVVDGKYVTAAGETGNGQRGAYVWAKYDFGSAAYRSGYFEVEGGVNVKAIAIPSGESFEPPPLPAYAGTWEATAAGIGDSILRATGATYDFDGFFPRMCDRMGIPHCLPGGNVGTSWAYRGSQNLKNGEERISDATDYDVRERNATGSYSVTNARWTFCFLGVNAITGNVTPEQEAAAFARFRDLHTKVRPGVPIFLFAPYNPKAPAAATAGYAAVKAALAAECVGHDNVIFVDIENVDYTKADATHPDDAGYDTLAEEFPPLIYAALVARLDELT